jgi:hypothetical protein
MRQPVKKVSKRSFINKLRSFIKKRCRDSGEITTLQPAGTMGQTPPFHRVFPHCQLAFSPELPGEYLQGELVKVR